MNTDIKVIDQFFTEHGAMYQGDCVELVKGLPDESIDFTLTSIPFSDQYTYSPSKRDMGNNVGDEGFFEHLEWLIPELLRVTKPGHLCAIHCKDRLRYISKWGTGGMNPFSDEVTRAMHRHGWQLCANGRITIATDPVRERSHTNRLGLRYKDIREDATLCAPGFPEYLMVYRKWQGLDGKTAFAPERVTHTEEDYPLSRWQLEANAIWQSDGFVLPVRETEQMPPYNHEARIAALQEGYDLVPAGDSWRRVLFTGGKYNGPRIHTGTPWVWPDINRMDTRNLQVVKEHGDEKHICPLQLDLVERAIHLWTNKGDVVLDPFAGIGSVPGKAVEMGRIGIGFELKESYFRYACKYLAEAEQLAKTETLFDIAA